MMKIGVLSGEAKAKAMLTRTEGSKESGAQTRRRIKLPRDSDNSSS